MPTWSTASEFDAFQSETGVVHEDVANTDLVNDARIRMGYSAASPFKSADLWAYWPLHEDSGTTVYDFSGNNHDGTRNGATQSQTAPLDTTGYSFDGTDDFVQADYAGSFGSGFTVTAWVNLQNKPSNRMMIWGAYDPDDGDDFILFRWASDQFEAFVRDDSGTGSSVSGSTAPSTGTWYFVAVRYDDANGSATIFLDASEDGTLSQSWGTIDIDESDIGRMPRDNNNHWNGYIWDVRVYQTPLANGDIKTLHNVVTADGSYTSSKKQF